MNIGIIGFGNLGRALASGLVMSGCVSDGCLFVCDSSPQAREAAQGAPYNARTVEDINDVLQNASVLFLTVKSYVFEELSLAIDRNLLIGKTVVSFMAGMSIERILELLGSDIRGADSGSMAGSEAVAVTRENESGLSLVRAMPSLAIATCEGVIGYTSAPPDISAIFHKLGFAFETEPENIEKVMAFSSCGLGFAAYLIDAFAAAGKDMGFSSENAVHIAALTFKNAVDRGHFRETVSAVATPGGATEQGIVHMDERGVYETVASAVQKAYERMV